MGTSKVDVVGLPGGGAVPRLPQDAGGVDVAVFHRVSGIIDREPPEGEGDGVVWAPGVLVAALVLYVAAVDVGDG